MSARAAAALGAALALLAGCSAGRRAEPAPGAALPAPPPPPAPPARVENPDFELVVAETVVSADDEGASFTKVFVDGQEAGRTEPAPRSQERRLALRLAPGNHPVRLEHWQLPSVGEWAPLPEERQPRERFVRVEDGSIARLSLRYGSDGLPTLRLTREPAGPRP